jgi:inhibitor of cysteine peptidase
MSNISNRVQIANYTIGDRGTNSSVFNDHRAFLFDKSKNLLVLPVLEAKVDEANIHLDKYHQVHTHNMSGKTHTSSTCR